MKLELESIDQNTLNKIVYRLQDRVKYLDSFEFWKHDDGERYQRVIESGIKSVITDIIEIV